MTLLLGYDVDFHEQLPVVLPHLEGAREMFGDEAVRHGLGSSNGWLQTGYLLMGIRAAGLVAGPMGGFDRDGVDAAFPPSGRTKSLLIVNVGHPGANPWFGRNSRLSYDDVVTSA